MNELQTDNLLRVDQIRIDPSIALKIPPVLAIRRQVLPFALCDNQVHVACASDRDTAALDAVSRFVGAPVRAELAEPESLRRMLNRIFGDPQTSRFDFRNPLIRGEPAADNEADANEATALCDELMFVALIKQASDIHIEPAAESTLVRMRVDGILEPYRTFANSRTAGVVSRFKVLAGMDIAEKRAPQDGGFSFKTTPTQKVDVRVATLPTKHGERMTLRLLALQTESLTVERLGMSTRDLDRFERCVDLPHGLILLTGPTGSGKTTTLYAALRRLITSQLDNIITIEDPIEYVIPGVSQVEVDSSDKVNFSKALRSVLRHDPDVVMIGEIRDYETADVAIKGSLTGHLVFSTLHTNSAVGVVTRLIDMGIERFLIGAVLRLAVSQRLVRKLCAHCRKEHALTTSDAASLGRVDLAGARVFEKSGCRFCINRGYNGRVGLFELFAVNEAMTRLIAGGATEEDLQTAFRESGGRSLLDDAHEKLLNGQSSVSELVSAITFWG